ncbi:hypothetical protein D3C85_1738840 [compost metagenome]
MNDLQLIELSIENQAGLQLEKVAIGFIAFPANTVDRKLLPQRLPPGNAESLH